MPNQKDPKVLIVQALLIGYGVLVTHMMVRRAELKMVDKGST
ncbi:hypothetical protein [Acidithrix ferrooxidans]|nr:hypothetical protein [Acidithrix ferrooxidans]